MTLSRPNRWQCNFCGDVVMIPPHKLPKRWIYIAPTFKNRLKEVNHKCKWCQDCDKTWIYSTARRMS